MARQKLFSGSAEIVVHLEKLFFYEGSEVPKTFYPSIEASSGGYYRVVCYNSGHQKPTFSYFLSAEGVFINGVV